MIRAEGGEREPHCNPAPSPRPSHTPPGPGRAASSKGSPASCRVSGRLVVQSDQACSIYMMIRSVPHAFWELGSRLASRMYARGSPILWGSCRACRYGGFRRVPGGVGVQRPMSLKAADRSKRLGPKTKTGRVNSDQTRSPQPMVVYREQVQSAHYYAVSRQCQGAAGKKREGE